MNTISYHLYVTVDGIFDSVIFKSACTDSKRFINSVVRFVHDHFGQPSCFDMHIYVANISRLSLPTLKKVDSLPLNQCFHAYKSSSFEYFVQPTSKHSWAVRDCFSVFIKPRK